MLKTLILVLCIEGSIIKFHVNVEVHETCFDALDKLSLYHNGPIILWSVDEKFHKRFLSGMDIDTVICYFTKPHEDD